MENKFYMTKLCVYWVLGNLTRGIRISYCQTEREGVLSYQFTNILDAPFFRVCGNNEDKLPIKMSSTSNELSLFFRSSLKISGRGFNCSYSITPITKAPSKIKNHNGDGKICLLGWV